MANRIKRYASLSRGTQASSTRATNLSTASRRGIAGRQPRVLGIQHRKQSSMSHAPLPNKDRRETLLMNSSYVGGSTPRNGEEAWFLKYAFALEQLRELPENWDSYGAEPPNLTALYWSKTVLELLFGINFPPSRVTPSVENGVGISFICDKKYADIECFNTGEILAVTSDRRGKPDVWEVDNNIEAIKSALERIRVFIRN